MRGICRTASTPAFFVEDENRRFRNGTRCDVELVIVWKHSPFSRAIIQCVEPTTQRLAVPGWYGINGSPCAADVSHRKTGLCEQRVDSVSERPR